MARSGPPAYAWDWFARQRLLWREVRSRLASAADPVAVRYAAVDTRTDVVPMLRADYPRDPLVRRTVDEVVAELAFLGRIDTSFASLGLRNPPRGLRWWWSALTGEETGPASGAAAGAGTPDVSPAGSPQRSAATSTTPTPPVQLRLDDVHEGYGG